MYFSTSCNKYKLKSTNALIASGESNSFISSSADMNAEPSDVSLINSAAGLVIEELKSRCLDTVSVSKV